MTANELAANMYYELVPMKGIDEAIQQLPPASTISVTCSPVKGIKVTMKHAEDLVAAGHTVIPHISARLAESTAHTAEIADWIKRANFERIFLVAGDAPEPVGPYEGVVPFLHDLLSHDLVGVHIGVTAYPEGHALIADDVVAQALAEKQRLILEAGLTGSMTTQMCFDGGKIIDWLQAQRDAGITLPAVLGVPGVVSKIKLAKMGARLGLGPSLRYVSKNKASVTKLLAPGGFDPTELLDEIGPRAAELNVIATHSFTFNNVAATHGWQRNYLAQRS